MTIESSETVLFAAEPKLAPVEFVDLLARTSLGARRPIDDLARIARMLEQADVIVTARISGRLVGVARALTDFSFCTYLSDLAVDEAFQGRGIGYELMREVHAAAGLETRLILIAAPLARTYYAQMGLEPHDSCWMIPPGKGLPPRGTVAPS
jgi:predicted N-acetyltransferase YhbS